ncbi:hypothetical protein IUD19_10775 [Xylella fastidiosa subsp. multiplex]|uniref:hypothetical protein n=4 Tax=Xylella fastidiosa TaxID=2371 RepID=UPI00189288D2|nr:hypothetical protein [Xylella fastidiosa]QPC02210.1 hypothetical protein IUD19_10775 [Xylella fastidiosa subsp. multiplex]
MSCWVVGLLGCWVVGLLGCWVVGLLGCWVVGLLGCWVVGLLGCWVAVVGGRVETFSRSALTPLRSSLPRTLRALPAVLMSFTDLLLLSGQRSPLLNDH